MTDNRDSRDSSDTFPDNTLTGRNISPIRESVTTVTTVTDEGGETPLANAETGILRDGTGKLLPGTATLNPSGRPRGGGRLGALRIIDELLAEHRNQARLREALQTEFDKNPIKFLRTLIVPLLPRTVSLDLTAGGSVRAAVVAVRTALGMERGDET